MRRVYWHLMRRFYRVRSIRALTNHLKFKDRSVKYSSLIENYEAHHKNPEPRFDSLPSGWWIAPSVAACAGLILFALALA